MKMKAIAMMAAVGCAVTMLTGCGVPKEDHEAKIAELNTAWQEIESLKGKNTDLESLLKAEQTKLRTARIELDDAAERISASQTKQAETASALATEKSKALGLESEVSSAKAETMSAQEAASEAEAALAKLQEDYKTLEGRFDQFSKNMQALDGTQSAPGSAHGSARSDAEAAMDLLNQMSTQ
jgi:chromosome segregation ATPase